MRKFQMQGGGTISAETNEEIVQKLNADSLFGRQADLNKFMEDTTKACLMQNGAVVRASDADSFVEDLIAGGFLIEIIL